MQDGDSNFVSNDSTSQEPNIDENTTQTTATTSTDGDVGTPLASDSESNMEAPANTKIANAIASSGVTGAAIAAPLMPIVNSTTTANGADNNSISTNPVVAVGNGNGALTTAPTAVNNDEDVSGEDEDDEEEDDEEEDGVEDEESNGATVLTPLGTENTDPTLVAQKRALQCGSDGGGIIDECSQPDLKKIRSE